MTNLAAIAPAAYAASVFAPSVMVNPDTLAPMGAVQDGEDGLWYDLPRHAVEVELISRDDEAGIVELVAYRQDEGTRRFRLNRVTIAHEGGQFTSWLLGVYVPGLAGVVAAVTYVATPADGANAARAFLTAGPGVGNTEQAAAYAGGIRAAWARFEASLAA